MKKLRDVFLISAGVMTGLCGASLAMGEKAETQDVLFTDFVCSDEMGGEMHHGRSYGGDPVGVDKPYGEYSYATADGGIVTQYDIAVPIQFTKIC